MTDSHAIPRGIAAATSIASLLIAAAYAARSSRRAWTRAKADAAGPTPAATVGPVALCAAFPPGAGHGPPVTDSEGVRSGLSVSQGVVFDGDRPTRVMFLIAVRRADGETEKQSRPYMLLCHPTGELQLIRADRLATIVKQGHAS
jgi:hypothetical protein